MITLFAEPPRSSTYSFTFLISVILHASLFSLLGYKVAHTRHVIERFPIDHYSVHLLDFHSTPPQARQATGALVYSVAHPAADSHTSPLPPSNKPAASDSAAAPAPVTRLTARLLPARQTLIQPDVPKNVVLPDKTPVPLTVIWQANKTPMPRIVPPLPEKAVVVEVHPSIDTPIAEEKIADLKLAATAIAPKLPTPPPSTTSPVVVHGPEEARKVPETTSKQPEKPTPARVIALSDVRVPEGKVAVPVANQTSAKLPPGSLVPGVLKDPTPAAGNGNAAGKAGQTGSGKGTADHAAAKAENSAGSGNAPARTGSGDKTATAGAGKDAAAKTTAGPATPTQLAAGAHPQPANDKPARVSADPGPAIAAVEGSSVGSAISNQPPLTHISLPKDGQFGVVVVGSSIEDKYPETAELWSGRLASTVYLHVGLAKSWILQYTLPRLIEASNTGSGRLEAPWPYEIVRPNLISNDVDSDAIILHGFVNKDGRFEKLEVVFPPKFTQAAMVVNVLNQWHFRPARQDGLFIPVEVLLIIPDQLDQ